MIPESPRWLVVHARYDEAKDLLQKVCRTNHRELPADFDPKCLVDDFDKVNIVQTPLHQFPRNFPVDGEAANLLCGLVSDTANNLDMLPTSLQQVGN